MKGSVAAHPLGERGKECTGCAACAAACASDSLAMAPDCEGFLQPQRDAASCNGCGECRRVCPVTARTAFCPELPGEPRRVFAAWHLDPALRAASSSGGVFSAVGRSILSRGGVVCGAAFDARLTVRHRCVEQEGALGALRGSKYVQSAVEPALLRELRTLLEAGRPVLFTGTPCQVAGVRSFLKKPFATLYCCDLVCHGTPSPLLWQRYLLYAGRRGRRVTGFSFRDKRSGWKESRLHLELEGGESRGIAAARDSYMAAFLRDYALRPCCYSCPFSTTSRYGDLTLADFWGVGVRYPEYDREDLGTSLLLENSARGGELLEACRHSLFLGPADLETAVEGNPMLARPSRRPPERDTFYRDLIAIPYPALVKKYRLAPPSPLRRLLRRLKRRLLSTLPER